MTLPDGNEEVRPFVPARDFDLSRAFYRALGFSEDPDKDIAIFTAGRSTFILQRYYQKDWAENFMMHMMVDDLDAWWRHVETLDLPGKFGVPAPKAPEMQSWGLRVAYVYDPSGVLWHIAQRRAGKPTG